MIMKKVVILLCCVLIFLTSCNFDPYSDKRPTDLGNALWKCDKYKIWFVVDSEKKITTSPKENCNVMTQHIFASSTSFTKLTNCI